MSGIGHVLKRYREKFRLTQAELVTRAKLDRILLEVYQALEPPAQHTALAFLRFLLGEQQQKQV
jgi:hypothetical protein